MYKGENLLSISLISRPRELIRNWLYFQQILTYVVTNRAVVNTIYFSNIRPEQKTSKLVFLAEYVSVTPRLVQFGSGQASHNVVQFRSKASPWTDRPIAVPVYITQIWTEWSGSPTLDGGPWLTV